MDTEADLHALLASAAARWGDRPFLESEDRRLSFRQAQDESSRMAGLLRASGVAPGDRILIAHAEPISAVVTLLGALSLGAVCTIGDPAATRFAAENVVSDLRPHTVLADESSAYADLLGLGELARDLESPAGAALIMYTSGSTGRPKGIVSSHRNVAFAATAIQERLRLRPDDRVACLLPLTFDYGLYQVFLALVSGCAVIFGSPQTLGAAVLSFLVRHQVSVLPSVSTLSRMLLALAERPGAALPALRMVTNTGESMSESLLRRIQRTFPDAEVFPMFGLTECKRVSILLPSEIDDRPTSVGRPLIGTWCEIVDSDGATLPPLAVGELVVHGPHVTLGYWRDQELTDRVFPPVGGRARALLTGDKAWMDEAGYLYFRGREDDIFKRRGFRASTAEIAFAAEQVEGVTDAVCFLGVDESDRQEVNVVVTGSATPEQVATGLAGLLAPHLRPDRIEVVEKIPLTRHAKADVRLLATLRRAST